MKNTILFCLLLVTSLVGAKVKAQDTYRQTALLELVRIAEVYRKAPSLSFSIEYTYINIADPDSTLEHVSGQAKAANGKYWSLIDSVETVQGAQYSITVFRGDTLMMVNDRSAYGDLIRVPFLDSAFRAGQVDTMELADIDSSTKSFTATFLPGSGYNNYTLQYHPKSFRVKKVVYQLVDDTSSTPFTGQLTISFTGYSTAQIDEAIFQESRYLVKQLGQFVPSPAFAGYTIVNNTSN